ncbi:MAG: hypothetical protein MOB07_29720 [Acidobacteria bacterium]|nr:hypothetical protein [Acidobacteriota bacterium]
MKKPEVAETLATQETQVARIIPIRTETVLSQYPIHKLSKDKKPVQIKLTKENERGKVETTWKVSPNAEYGHPGILAYKLDTLFINRLIDELHPIIPEVIKIGESLNDIGKHLGREGTRNTTELVYALHQNASAYIKAKLEYTGKDGARRRFEFGSTRYAVVMIGESLPDGTKAEAVYIVLNPLFREVLQNAKRRPLDYEYLKELPPAAQRWYELVSFQMFAALNNNNRRAKYHYSELCARAPITRFDNWEQAKKQLYKIHRPHIQSGYIKKVEFEETADEGGCVDWLMWYTPGPKARREFKEFTTKKVATPTPQPRPRLVEAKEKGGEAGAMEGTPEDPTLIEKLMSFGVDESRAARLVENDRAECELWSNAWPHQNQKGMENPPAVLISFIEKKRRPLPKGYREAIEHERRRKEYERQQARQAAEELHFQHFAPAFRSYLKEEFLEIERTRPDEYRAFKEHFDKKHAKGLRMAESEELREKATIHRAMEFFNEIRPELGVQLTTFDEWNEAENRENSDPVEWFNSNPEAVNKLLGQ